MFYIITQFPNYLFLLVFPEQKLSIQATLKWTLEYVGLPTKIIAKFITYRHFKAVNN